VWNSCLQISEKNNETKQEEKLSLAQNKLFFYEVQQMQTVLILMAFVE